MVRQIVWNEVRSRAGTPGGTTALLPLPTGEDRLRLAYLAVLELPELWNVLESLDESALAGVGAQLQLPPD